MDEARKTEKNEEKRRKILCAAGKLLAEYGAESVSMNQIAEKLNITKPVLYYYFKNKEELVNQAFIAGVKRIEDCIPGIESDMSVETKIEKILSGYMVFFEKYPDAPKHFFKLVTLPKNNMLSKLSVEYSRQKNELFRKSFSNENLTSETMDLLLRMITAAILELHMEAHNKGIKNINRKTPSMFAKLIAAGIRSMKMMFAVAALSLASAIPCHAEAISLEQAINIALRDNITVKNAVATSEKYDGYVDENIGSVYPQINFTGNYTRYFREQRSVSGDGVHKGGLDDNYITAGFNLNQVLWAGGKVGSAIKMAKIYSAAGKEELKVAQRDTIRQVKQMYYAVLLAKKMVEIQRETLNLSKQYLKTIEAKYKQGLSSDLELLRQRVEVSNNEPALTKAENSYEETLLKFKNLLGMEPDADIELSGDLQCGTTIYSSPVELYKTALENRAEYKDMKHMLDLYKEMIVVERAGHYPYLSLFAKQEYTGNSNKFIPAGDENGWNTYGGVSLSLPIYSGGSVNARVLQAQKQADIMENNLQNLERNIKIAVKTAWFSMNEAASRRESQNTAVEQARKALTATETRFKNGLAGLLDLNDMALAFNKTQTLYSQAAHDACSAGAQLEWTIGN